MIRVLGIVPARGGSKGVPRKNIAPVLGKPLLAFTAEAALAAKRLVRVVLSTEDEEIAEVGRLCGLEVPFLRAAALAADDTPTLPVLQDVVRRLEAEGDRFDAVFTLQPTSPLRLPADIDGAVELLVESNADSVVSLVELGGIHPFKMKQISCTGRVVDPPYAQGFGSTPRQQLPVFYALEGSVYLSRRDLLMEGGQIIGPDCRPWLVPRSRSVNVDSPEDLLMVEALLRRTPLGNATSLHLSQWWHSVRPCARE